MSPEAQRIAIAEACGWTGVRRAGPKHWDSLVGRSPRATHLGEGFERVPDYLNDLNAMHEAEKVLTRPQWESYTSALFVTCDDWPSALRATAAQRAEAFLRALNLWKD